MAFGECSALYSRSAPLCEHEIKKLEEAIDIFAHLRAVVAPEKKPTPKEHILGYHVIDIVKLKGSIGQDGEQVIESMHVWLNTVDLNLRNVKDPSLRMKLIANRFNERQFFEDLTDPERRLGHEQRRRHRLFGGVAPAAPEAAPEAEVAVECEATAAEGGEGGEAEPPPPEPQPPTPTPDPPAADEESWGRVGRDEDRDGVY